MTKPWERLKAKKESSKAYEAFCIYRDLGQTRSCEQVSKEVAKNAHHIRRWSSRYNWVERAAAYDDYIAEKQRKKYEAQLGRIKDKITDTGEAVLKKTTEEMLSDKPGAYAATERFTAVVNALWKVHGLDKTKIEHSGEVKTDAKLSNLRETLMSALTPEERAKLAAKWMELADGNSD